MTTLVNRSKAAELLGVSRPTVDHMLADGRLEATAYSWDGKALFSLEYLGEAKKTLVLYQGGRPRRNAEVAA